MADIASAGFDAESAFQQIKARIMTESPAVATARKEYWEERGRLLSQMEAEFDATARIIEERLSSRAAQQFNLRLRQQSSRQAEHAQVARDTASAWETVAVKLGEAQSRMAALDASGLDAATRRSRAEQIEQDLTNAYLTAGASLRAWRSDVDPAAAAAPYIAPPPPSAATASLPVIGVAAATGLAGAAAARARSAKTAESPRVVPVPAESEPAGRDTDSEVTRPTGPASRDKVFADRPATVDQFPLNPTPIPVQPTPATPTEPKARRGRPAPKRELPAITLAAVEEAVADMLVEAGSQEDMSPRLGTTLTLMTAHASEASLFVNGVAKALGERADGAAIARVDLDRAMSGDVWFRLGDALDEVRPRGSWWHRRRRPASDMQGQRRRVTDLTHEVSGSGVVPVFLLPDTSTLPVVVVGEAIQALAELTGELGGHAVALVALDLPRLADELSRDRGGDPAYGPGRVAPAMWRLFEVPPASALGRPRSSGAVMVTGGLPQSALASAQQSFAPGLLRPDQQMRAAWLWSLYHRLLGSAGARLAEPTLVVAMFAVAFYDVAVRSQASRPRAGRLLRAFGDKERWQAEVRAAGLDTPELKEEVWSLWELLERGGDQVVELGRHLLPSLADRPGVSGASWPIP